jgi:glycosyltransferase involved in cell wall biosynthesis
MTDAIVGKAGPFVSILLPSRNRLSLLKHAIASVLRQNFSSVELIISDNFSDEDYARYVHSLNDPKVRLVRTTAPVPVTQNWNYALLQATGQYVIMLGDDDALAPGSLARLRALAQEHQMPDVIYAMAYHYAYPGVLPGASAGYFATVKPRPIFSDHHTASLLDPALAQHFAAQALKFRHLFGFNSQFFAWKREFISSLEAYGPFFQSPYPDFYSSFVTLLKADRILIDPEPRAIIGISPKSFGFYLNNDQVSRGNSMLLLAEQDADPVRPIIVGASEALDLSGSTHYRNWLIAALYVIQNFGTEFDISIDLRRFRKLQIFELAFQYSFRQQPRTPPPSRLRDRMSSRELRLIDHLTWTFTVMRRAEQFLPQQIHDALFSLFRIYPKADVSYHDIGEHHTISDPWAWLDRRFRMSTATPSIEAAWETLASAQQELAIASSQRDDYRRQLAAEEGKIFRSTFRAMRQRFTPRSLSATRGLHVGSIRGNIDQPTSRIVTNPVVISGWAVDLRTHRVPDIRINIAGAISRPKSTNRPDVHASFSPQRDLPEALGFEFTTSLPSGKVSLALEFRLPIRGWKAAWRTELLVQAAPDTPVGKAVPPPNMPLHSHGTP